MAPSPEPGQPKAPDKTSPSSSSSSSSSSSVTASASATSSHSSSYGVSHINENSTSTLAASTSSSSSISSLSTLNNNNNMNNNNNNNISNNNSNSNINNNNNNSNNNNCYHQYTTSASMTNTTTTQSHSGTLVSPGTIGITTTNTSTSLSPSSSSLASTIAASVTTTTQYSINPSSNLNTANSAVVTNSNTERTNNKNVEDWNEMGENQLKELLDEAYSYKNPKDRENKSEMFLQLLQKAEREKEENSFSFRSITARYTRGSNNHHKHGGSLQDLVEAAQNDSLLDSDYGSYGTRARRHHHNSRPKKYSLVSSRQREGGSLPSNVNVSNCNLSVYEQPFLNEVVINKRRGKTERTCSGTSCTSGTSGTSSTVSTCGYESLSSSSTASQTNNKDDSLSSSSLSHFTIAASGDTIIDMGGDNYLDHDVQRHLAHDSLAQGISEPLEYESGIELSVMSKKIPRNPMNAVNHGKLETMCPEPRSWVDEQITFSPLERGSKCVDSSCLPLNEAHKCCKSLLDNDKSDTIKSPSSSSSIFAQNKMPSTSKQFDENGNALNSTVSYNSSSTATASTSISNQSQAKSSKKRKSQFNKNITTWDAQCVEGYRGGDTVEELVKFIESTNNSDPKKNDKNIKQESKRKEKKKDKDKDKEEKKKIKRSNSLEELRSCTKLDEDEKTESHVTMRSKGNNKKNNNEKMIGINNNTIDGKENIKQQQQQANHNKRGERRSWGTEELSYLGESNAIEEVREKVKEKEKSKKSKDLKDSKDVKDIKDNKDIKEIKDKDMVNEKHGKVEKVEKSDKIEKPERFEKIDKGEANKLEKNEHNKKKKDEHSLSVVSMESVSNESAEFHVVTKRKKAKKRQTLDAPLNSKSGNGNMMSTTGRSGENNSYMGNSKRYQASSHFTNDREVYLNSLNANESRRKSTSSVPPSEKSDSSDLDSVHSLPIGSSSSSRHIGHSSKNVVTITASANSNVPLSSSLGQTQPQSYADIARIVNLSKTSSVMMSSPSSTDKIDKWPVVQQAHSVNVTTNTNENSNISNVCINKGASSAGNSNTKKITQNKDFPDLISDKSNNQNNDAGSSCSSTSSTSTIVKQVIYSQSLGDEKHINDMMTSSTNATTTTTMSTTGNKSGNVSSSKPLKLIDAFKNNNNDGTTVSSSNSGNKQTLKKSKSIDIDAYCNFDQYPALEKTIKKHSQQNSNNNSVTVTNQVNTGTSKQRSISTNQLSTVGGGSGGHFNQLSNNNQSNNVVIMASQQQQRSTASSSLSPLNPSDNKSKLVNHILDINMNTNSNLISTSSSPNDNNLSNNDSNINSMINGNVNMINATISSGGSVTSNNGKKSNKQQQQTNNSNNMKVTNIESINMTPSSIQHHQNQLVEINNAKNKQIINQNMSNNEMINTTNVNKKTKSDTLQSSGAHNRKTKRDKNNQNNSSSGNNSGNISRSIVDLQQFPPLVSPSSLNSNNNNNNNSISNSSSNNNNTNNGGNNSSNSTSNKHSNRPAVIILNDIINDNSLSIVNDFTFGDFNEEELRLFENHIPLSDSDQFNTTSSSTSYQDITNEDVLCTTHSSSLHDSDHGYSSSTYNRSALSESNDGCSGDSSGSGTTIATQSQTDQNLIQGTTTMNIVVVDPSAIKIDTKQNLQQCTQGVSSSSSSSSGGAGTGAGAYYMEKIFSVSPNCMKTQAQTIYYQQQSQSSPSAQQQRHHHPHSHQQHQTTTILTTNLGTNVVAVVPITGDSSRSGVVAAAGGAGNITPINNNIQNNSTNISCSNSDLNLNPYQNVDTKVIEIVNCKCGKFNTDNVKQITTTIVSASEIVRSNNSSNNSSGGGEMNAVTSGGDNIVTINLNNSNSNVDKINNNIVISNNNNNNDEVINSQQQQQQEISSSTAADKSSKVRINSSDSNSSSKNEQNLGNNISKTISSSTTTMTNTSPSSSLLNKTLSSADVVAVTVAVALDTKNTKTGAACATSSVEINEISTTNNASNINTNYNNNNNNWDNNRKKTTVATKTKEINVRFIPPSIAHELNSINYDKIVDFVGLAWQEISGTNRGVQFYNGQ